MKNTKEKLRTQSKIVKSSFQQVDVASSLSITQACLREVGKLGSAFVHCNISSSNITKYSGINTVAKYMNRQNIVKSISTSFPTVWHNATRFWYQPDIDGNHAVLDQWNNLDLQDRCFWRGRFGKSITKIG